MVTFVVSYKSYLVSWQQRSPFLPVAPRLTVAISGFAESTTMEVWCKWTSAPISHSSHHMIRHHDRRFGTMRLLPRWIPLLLPQGITHAWSSHLDRP